jgi:hypothetical protein
MALEIPRFVKRLALISAIISFVSILSIVGLEFFFAKAPTTAIPEAGLVIDHNNHGTIHYITSGQYIFYQLLWALFLVSFILPAYVYWRTKKTLTWNG